MCRSKWEELVLDFPDVAAAVDERIAEALAGVIIPRPDPAPAVPPLTDTHPEGWPFPTENVKP